jgi:hypothetical protein
MARSNAASISSVDLLVPARKGWVKRGQHLCREQGKIEGRSKASEARLFSGCNCSGAVYVSIKVVQHEM